MGWVTLELKSILIDNGPRFFAAQKTDRNAVVDDIVEKLQVAKEDLSSERVSELSCFTARNQY